MLRDADATSLKCWYSSVWLKTSDMRSQIDDNVKHIVESVITRALVGLLRLVWLLSVLAVHVSQKTHAHKRGSRSDSRSGTLPISHSWILSSMVCESECRCYHTR